MVNRLFLESERRGKRIQKEDVIDEQAFSMACQEAMKAWHEDEDSILEKFVTQERLEFDDYVIEHYKKIVAVKEKLRRELK